MTDDRDRVFQCQYCGRHFPISDAVMAWASEDWASDSDRIVMTVVVTCSHSCAQKSNALRVHQ